MEKISQIAVQSNEIEKINSKAFAADGIKWEENPFFSVPSRSVNTGKI